MKLLATDNCDTHVIILTKAEGQALCTALTHATEPMEKPLNKRSKAWKIAHEIGDLLYVW